MEAGLTLTFGSLGFMILLLIYYNSKHKSSSITSKLYKIMILLIVFFLVTEIISTYFIKYSNSLLLSTLFMRLHWFFALIWILFGFYYWYCLLEDKKSNSIMELIKTDKVCKYFTIFSLICLVASYFFSLDVKVGEVSYIPGDILYYGGVYCIITYSLIFRILLKKWKSINYAKKSTVFTIAILLIIFFPFQVFLPQISFWGLITSVYIFYLYFYVENPDIKMTEELEKAKIDIDRSNMAKTDFLSNMSHEIRSPMNAIVGFSDTILNDPNFNEESIRTDIKHISTAGNNLLDIINNILDVSKIETGNETLEEKEYSVGNVIMELSSIIDSRLANRNIKFITEVDPNLPRKVYGDSTKLFQVLLNILTNSIKYTEVGRINLAVTKEIKNNYVTIKFKVSDTGYGIKKEDYEKLFNKFSRLSSATSNEIEGTGLGLVITKRYVDLLGGKIWFESDYGVGTTFYVEVTQKIIDQTPLGNIQEAQGSELTEDTYLDCTGKTVLVVDDNMLNIKVAKRILAKYNFTFDSATNGRDCIYRIKEGKHYDIIFLDHMMPEMDGIEVVHVLKKLKDFDIPPVVALTANAITGVRDMYLREGFDEYLSKPINTGELNHLINRYFGKCDL